MTNRDNGYVGVPPLCRWPTPPGGQLRAFAAEFGLTWLPSVSAPVMPPVDDEHSENPFAGG